MEILIGKQEIMITRRKILGDSANTALPKVLAPSPIEIILSYGFTRAGSCTCGGTRNEIYKKDSFILYLRKTRHVFKIKKKNDVLVPITSLTNLETELKKLFPDAVAVAEKV